jgi:hypothetical protein
MRIRNVGSIQISEDPPPPHPCVKSVAMLGEGILGILHINGEQVGSALMHKSPPPPHFTELYLG